MRHAVWLSLAPIILLSACGLNPGVDLPSASPSGGARDAGAVFAGGGGESGSANVNGSGAGPGMGGASGAAGGSPSAVADAGISDAGPLLGDAAPAPADAGQRGDH
jgi:hypothetical protein